MYGVVWSGGSGSVPTCPEHLRPEGPGGGITYYSLWLIQWCVVRQWLWSWQRGCRPPACLLRVNITLNRGIWRKTDCCHEISYTEIIMQSSVRACHNVLVFRHIHAYMASGKVFGNESGIESFCFCSWKCKCPLLDNNTIHAFNYLFFINQLTIH